MAGTHPVSLIEWRKVEKKAAALTPILLNRSEITKTFRGASFRPKPFPRGTIAFSIFGLPGGSFVGLPRLCISDPDVTCRFDEGRGTCICQPASGPGGVEVAPILGCRLDFSSLRCAGTCAEQSKKCKLRFRFGGIRAARLALSRQTMLRAEWKRPTLAIAVRIVESLWPYPLHLDLACACD